MMRKYKYERFLPNLVIERTLFFYNIVLSNQFKISKKFKRKYIRFLEDAKKYLIFLKYQSYDMKSMEHHHNQYKNLRYRIDFLIGLFDKIDEHEKIKHIYSENLFYNLYGTSDPNVIRYKRMNDRYIIDFLNFFVNLDIKSIKNCKYNNPLYYNKFCLL